MACVAARAAPSAVPAPMTWREMASGRRSHARPLRRPAGAWRRVSPRRRRPVPAARQTATSLEALVDARRARLRAGFLPCAGIAAPPRRPPRCRSRRSGGQSRSRARCRVAPLLVLGLGLRPCSCQSLCLSTRFVPVDHKVSSVRGEKWAANRVLSAAFRPRHTAICPLKPRFLQFPSKFVRTALNDQYGKPLLNGLAAELLGHERLRPAHRGLPRRSAAFLQQFHSGLRRKPRIAWKP